MSISPNLNATIAAQTRVLGEDLLKNDAAGALWARLLLSILQAYGAAPTAFLYISPTRARSTHPPDLVLCHPITAIQNIEAGHLFVTYANRPQPR